MSIDPDKLFSELEKAAEERADAEEKAHKLERLGEILLADLMLQAKNQGHPISLCKEVARSSPEWRTHIDGESVALGDRSRKRARYENLRILWEARRTLEVTTRSLAR